MEKNKKYRLAGIINMYDYNMDIVYPVFMNDGLFYFQKIKGYKIESFELIHNINLLEKIKVFEGGITNKLMKKNCSIGDNAFFAFQTDENDVYVSTLNGFLRFLKTIRTSDSSLNLEIKKFIQDNEKAKTKTLQNKSY